jgi:hypothetical protein
MERRKRIFCSLTFTFSIFFFLTNCSGAYSVRYAAGPIQIIGNQNEIWIFLELDRIVSQNKSFYDTPSSYPIGHFQELLILNQNGLRERVKIKGKEDKCGVTFHPNNSLIFNKNGIDYLYSFPSMYYQESLFKWNMESQSFDILSLQKGVSFLKKYFNFDSYNEKIYAMNKASVDNGWVPIYSDSNIGNDFFIWNNKSFTISVHDQDNFFDIVIKTREKSEGYPIVLRYKKESKTLTTKEVERLSREEKGHPKP